VRNPYTRIISIYNYFINGGNQTINDRKKLNKNLDINDFLINYNQNNFSFLKTQFSYLQDSHYDDFIGRFENFTEDLKFICNKYNLEFNNIHKRKTEYNINYILTPKFIDMISDIYDIDFVKYNYKKIKIDNPITLKDFYQLIT